jgi:Rhodopirellula transposase DDE domain
LERLVEPVSRGDPSSALRWTCKSRAKLTAALTKAGWFGRKSEKRLDIDPAVQGSLLADLGVATPLSTPQEDA